MLIHALDPATRTGSAFGLAGEAPFTTAFRIRGSPEETSADLCLNMGQALREMWRAEKPDLVVYEEPMGVYSWLALCQRLGRPQNGESVEMAHQLFGVVAHLALAYRIRFEPVSRQKVLKFFTGSGRHGGREAAKDAVLQKCKALGLLDSRSADDDRADAIAMHFYASSVFARIPPKEFRLTPT